MMNKALILFVASTLLFFSCYHENHPQVEVPDNLLSKQKMVDVLTDIYLAEGAFMYHRSNKNLNQELSTVYYNQIFEVHHINHRILKDNFGYYNSDPEVMEEILEDVLSNLSKLQAEVSAMEDPLNDTIPLKLNDTFPGNFPPSVYYQKDWSFASLIDSLLLMPVDSVYKRINDSTIFE